MIFALEIRLGRGHRSQHQLHGVLLPGQPVRARRNDCDDPVGREALRHRGAKGRGRSN